MTHATEILFLIGPPGSPETKAQFEEFSENTGKPREELWLESTHETLSFLAKHDVANEASKLDNLFSGILRTEVRFAEPFISCAYYQGSMIPAMTLHLDKITTLEGYPEVQNWSDSELQQLLCSSLGLVLDAEWIRSDVLYF